jgi:tRNA(Ile)-lysidine synthase
LQGGSHTRELRDLFQEAGIPPWQRSRLPLVLDAGNVLLAVGDLWISDVGAELFARANARLDWHPGSVSR